MGGTPPFHALQCTISPRIRVADTANSWPRSFFESLFGKPQESKPRPPRRPRAHRSLPRRVAAREAPRRQPMPSPTLATGGDRAGRLDAAATFRTMCVRLCDGYYWPISFATHEARFARDSASCSKSCGAPAALYYYPNPGGEPEDMVSLQGVPYKNLGTAFLFRSRYDAGCKCRPHPWEGEERGQPPRVGWVGRSADPTRSAK